MKKEQILSESWSKIIGGTMILGLGAILRIFFSFLGLTIATIVSPKDNLGFYFLIFAIVASLEVLCGLGLGQSAAKFVASEAGYQERQVIVKNILTFRLVTMLSFSLLAIVCQPVFLCLFPSELLPSLFVYVHLLFCIQGADLLLYYIMQGFQFFRKMAFIRALNSALDFALVLLLLVVVKFGVKGYILVNILSLSFSGFLRFWMISTRKALAFVHQMR